MSVRASAKPLPSAVRTPATTLPVAGSMMSPTALTATSAATTRPSGSVIDADPMPAFIDRPGPRHLADGRARSRADVALGHRPVGGAPAPPRSRTRRSGGPWLAAEAEVEQDRRGHDRHLRDAGVVAEARAPRDTARRPCAASRPKALPPESTMALTFCTWLTGSSRSVSRVPGAPPRTSTLATAPVSVRMTVQPVGRSVSV